MVLFLAIALAWTAPADLTSTPEADLVERLARDSAADRQAAHKELLRRKALAPLAAFVADDAKPAVARVEALNAIASQWPEDTLRLSREATRDIQPAMRERACNLLATMSPAKDEESHLALVPACDDREPKVRAAALNAVGRIGHAGALDTLMAELKMRREGDLPAAARALDWLGKPAMKAVISLAESGSDVDLELAVQAFAHFRQRDSYDHLGQLLRNPHLSIPQRSAVVSYYGHHQAQSPISMAPILDYIYEHPDEAADVESSALRALARGRFNVDPRLEKYLTGALNVTDAEVRAAACEAVAKYHPVSLKSRIVALTGDGPAAVRGAALGALRSYSLPEFQILATKWLTGDDGALVKEAVLQMVKHPKDAEHITTAWRDGSIKPAHRLTVKQLMQSATAKDPALAKIAADLNP